MVELQEQYMY